MSENAIAFNVLSESFSGGVTIQITCATAGADIYYTTDNSTPSASNGTKYTEAFEVTQNTTVKAVAVKDGLLDSEVASASFSVSLPTPVLQKQDGTASDNCKVVITNYADYASYSGFKLVYTTDNSEPLETGTTTTGEIAITSNVTVKVKAFCTGYDASATAFLAVSDLKVQTPVIETVAQPSAIWTHTVQYADKESPFDIDNLGIQLNSVDDVSEYDYYVTIKNPNGTLLDNAKATNMTPDGYNQIRTYIANDGSATATLYFGISTEDIGSDVPNNFTPNAVACMISPTDSEDEYPMEVSIKVMKSNEEVLTVTVNSQADISL